MGNKITKITRESLILGCTITVGLCLYFGMQYIQSYAGKQAFAQTGLTPLTLAQAKAQAKHEGKRVFADLSAYWCGTCRAIDRQVLNQPVIHDKLNASYVYARIDSESKEAPAFMRDYDAKGYPTLIIIEPDGTLVKRLPLTLDANALAREL